MNKFYHALDKIVHFQLCKILLATATHSQLEAMMTKDLPYFSNFSQDLNNCLNGANCQGLRDIVQTLGKGNLKYLNLNDLTA